MTSMVLKIYEIIMFLIFIPLWWFSYTLGWLAKFTRNMFIIGWEGLSDEDKAEFKDIFK